MIKLQTIRKIVTVRIIFSMALLVVVLLSALAYLHVMILDKSKDDLVNTYKVNIELEQLISTLKDAETGNRGYFITKDSAFLEPYFVSKNNVNESLSLLKALLKHNPSQLQRLSKVYDLVNLRYSYFATSFSNGENFEKITQGKKIMDDLRVLVDEMIIEQDKLLEIRNASYESKNFFTPFFSFAVFLLALIIMIVGYINISRNYEEIQKSNKQLLLLIESNNQAELISKSSSWVWNLDDNKFRYSDNQFRLLGFEPVAFEPSNENFLKVVHPEDVEIVSLIMDLMLKEEKSEAFQFRILKKDGETRRLESTGQLYLDFFGNKSIIGITRDITEEYEKKVELELLLKELLEKNQELMEFNHAASHDLQEPLRKIQTFISRLKNTQGLEEKAQEYLEKIDRSSLRMRGLIDDLLQFSKVGLSRVNFVRVDLNEVLGESIAELSEDIAEKSVEIIFGELPTVDGVYFQFKQLFLNLISNSIKYSSENTPPIIEIQHEIIYSTDELLPLKAKNINYHKFVFKDNGMGFKQEYAEKVFLLFERLHGKKDYPGTGVGLAICKKIIEAHHGFIKAESKLGNGTSILFYIPV